MRSVVKRKEVVESKTNKIGLKILDDHQADGHWTTSSEEPESMNSLSKLVSKLKFWRRISGTTSGAVNAAQRDLQGYYG